VILIVLAVLLTMQIKNVSISRKKLITGILWGVLSVLTTAIGVVMIKPLLNQVPLLWAVEIRLIAGFVALLLITLFLPNRRKIFSSLKTIKGLGYSLSGTFFGTYLALVIWLAGMKYTTASIASALNQTSSVFVFIFAGIILKEKITFQYIIALIVAISGVLFVFFG
ncbi:MAG: DMT family transporter, partial [candidate division WOR-3 bacterium]|nr:DMT family transporter [candidate division WOR-3 bacterium]